MFVCTTRLGLQWTPPSILVAFVILSIHTFGCDSAPSKSFSEAVAVAGNSTAPDQSGMLAGTPDASPNRTQQSLTLGDTQTGLLTIGYDGGFTLQWSRDGQPLTALNQSSLRLGIVPQLADNLSYDPFPLVTNLIREPQELKWVVVQNATLDSADDTSARLTLLTEVGELSLSATLAQSGNIHIELSDIMFENAELAYWQFSFAVTDNEGLYGLGEWYDTLNHRGKIRAMQLELDPELEEGYNEVHAPIPFLLSTLSWGLFIPTDLPGVFDVAASQPQQVTATFGRGQPDSTSIKIHLYASEHPLDLTKHYYTDTGSPRLPAPWALGPWIWRDENEDQAQVLEDMRLIRELSLPTSGYWIDRPYASAVNSFDFEAARFPDPTLIATTANTAGLKLALWHAPYLEDLAGAVALRAEAERKGFFPSPKGVLLNEWSAPVDFTHPEVTPWWQNLLTPYLDLGVIGFKLDYAEDIVLGLNGVRIPWGFFDGSDERTMHSRYQRLYHAAYADLLPDDGGFLICRTARWGDQVNSNVIWPADLDADFSRFKERRIENGEEYGAVGGLPAALIAGLGLGPSGFPFYASDTGGYRHSPPDKETFIRWLQMSALGTVMQTGTKTSDVPWEFTTENGFDQEVLDNYRTYATLNIRLFPYKWSFAQQLSVTGHTITRPLGLAYPKSGKHPDDQFLLGDSILVAPVVDRDARSKQVLLPPGQWVHWWNGTVYEGALDESLNEVTVDAPITELPLFVKAGAIIPMLRPEVQTLAYTSNEQVDSFARQTGHLWLRSTSHNPSEDLTGTLYDESTWGRSANAITYQAGTVFNQGVVIELTEVRSAPSRLTMNDQVVEITTDESVWSMQEEGAVYLENTKRLLIKSTQERLELSWSN